MCFPQIQANNKPSRLNQCNTPTKGRSAKKERVGSPLATIKPSNQTAFSPNAVDTWFALQQASQPTSTPGKGRRVKKKGSRVKKERVQGETRIFEGEKKGSEDEHERWRVEKKGQWKNGCPLAYHFRIFCPWSRIAWNLEGAAVIMSGSIR